VVVEHRRAPRGNPAWDNPVERLFNTPALGLKHEWVFNASDTDPYPSMPHGHLYKNKQRRDKPKLDPYRNRIVPADKRVGDRESKRGLIRLWNLPEFQEVALGNLRLHRDANSQLFYNRLRDERGIDDDPFLLPPQRRARRVAGRKSKRR
jgi:hypothetical protein